MRKRGWDLDLVLVASLCVFEQMEQDPILHGQVQVTLRTGTELPSSRMGIGARGLCGTRYGARNVGPRTLGSRHAAEPPVQATEDQSYHARDRERDHQDHQIGI